MLVGMALYVRLMVCMGLSLFIIRPALRVYGCMRIYAYSLTVMWRFLLRKASLRWKFFFLSRSKIDGE